jgi:hypothetical protein
VPKQQTTDLVDIDYNDVDLMDATHPSSLVNKLPSFISNSIRVIPDSILSLDEELLKKEGRCDIVESRLRQSFWLEYDRACMRGGKMNVSAIYSGVCSRKHFHSILSNTFKVAYVIRPPINYKVALHELLTIGIEQMRQILITPHIDEDGKFNSSHANQKLKIMETVFERALGAVVQRVEQKNLNVSVESDGEDVEAQIREVQEKILKSQGRLIDAGKEDQVS